MGLNDLDLGTIEQERVIDPNEIFRRLTLRGSIQNIWGPQEAALREWHEKYRTHPDNIIQMNTGGGKTLVGLLMAQSLVNETRGKVFYVCSNNQLIEQTVEKAQECGMNCAYRFAGAWHRKPDFDRSETFCITNYATLFNGLSIFRGVEVDAVVFDDAHVAENHLRSQFTILYDSESKVFKDILALFRYHFAASCMSSKYDDIVNRVWDALLYVPIFLTVKHANEIRKILLDSNIENHENNKYPWEHLKNSIDLCMVIFSGQHVEITPSILPLHKTVYFGRNARRIYLTATIPTKTSFLRTFNVNEPDVISPPGKSGDAQRLFVFPLEFEEDKQKDEILRYISKNKACVISPSWNRAAEWAPPATIYDPDKGHSEIVRFCKSKSDEILSLVARYDGVDLPGDACRILVLDRLPHGENLFNKFIDHGLQISYMRSSHTAIRIIQAIGRIFRSNTDHGVVMIRGEDIKGWLMTPKYQRLLPPLLQKQVKLGIMLYDGVQKGKLKNEEPIHGILKGTEDWDNFYKKHIDLIKSEELESESETYEMLLFKEIHAYTKLWERQNTEAVSIFSELVEKAMGYEERMGAWYLHWKGLAQQLNNDNDGALLSYAQAANIRVELGRPEVNRDKIFLPRVDSVVPQAKRISDYYKRKRHRIKAILEGIDADLNYGPETKKTEEAVKQLGFLLGFESSRPDNEVHTGPDVLWVSEGNPLGVSFELKTNKDSIGEYCKDDIKDCHDHREWLSSKFSSSHFIEMIVGKHLPVSGKANPSPELRIITIEALRDLFERIRDMYLSVEGAGQVDSEVEFSRWIHYHGLLWPNCIDAIPSRLAIDMKSTKI